MTSSRPRGTGIVGIRRVTATEGLGVSPDEDFLHNFPVGVSICAVAWLIFYGTSAFLPTAARGFGMDMGGQFPLKYGLFFQSGI
jgi:hypothetical protein